MMKKVFTLLMVVATSLHVSSQEKKFGKVSVAELTEKSHPADSSASAAYLYKIGSARYEYSAYDGFYLMTIVKARIKIYNKDGYDWSNLAVPYYLGHGNREEVRFSDAATYNLEDGKIVKTKLKNDGEFNENINQYWARKKITMPNVKEGSVIEYEYSIKSNTTELRPFDFQSSIPTNYAEYKTIVPEYFKYNAVQRGFIYPKVTTVDQSRTFEMRIQDPHLTGARNMSRGTQTMKEIQTTYVAENLPAMRDEAYVNNISNYTSGVTHELSVIQFPETAPKLFATDWETVVTKIYENDDFGDELNKSGYFEEDVKKLISNLDNNQDKIAAIFNHVKSTMTWNEYNGYTCDKGVKQAYKEKAGNVAEINLMLTAMLRYAGIEANPVLVSTRANGIAVYPSRTAFNYVIAAVETPEGLLLFDATEKYSTANVLPTRDINWFGRLIRKDGSSSQVDLVPQSSSKSITTLVMTPTSDGNVEGKVRLQYTGQNALAFRQSYAKVNEEAYIESLENRLGNIAVDGYRRENDFDVTKVLTESFDFNASESVEVIGDRIYLSPLLFFTQEENPFKQEQRLYPVDFSYPQQHKFTINIDIPDGYSVESLPEGLNVAMERNLAMFRYNIAVSGNKVQLSIISDINAAIFPAEFYAGLKDYYRQIIDKQNEKIIFKKA